MILNYIQRAKQFKTKKRLGQNFLVDESIINKIISEAALNSDDTVIEIGAGAGFVTEKLAEIAKKVIAVELDEDAIEVLQQFPYENIEIIHKDILKTDISALVQEPVKIIANIPYYITSPIIAHLLGEIDEREEKNKNRYCIKEIILMVQYEVAKRIIANEKSPSKDYGLLSILANYRAETEFICKVPSKSFYPAPKVDSALIKLKIRKKPLVEVENPKLFRQIIKAAFGTRRKTLKNALIQGGFPAETVSKALEKSGINPDRRGETLSMQEFKVLTDIIDNL
ncbi:MAG: ribosomal RNA small subunit methyltransferase A [Candidatus Melainabacteria bacterium GWF2_32_7]|nr:MAG: ribosomal RNA small subunit methyltransferase A [Candidatus Melainabacteria bacterium GWF2_32_7]